MRPLAATIATCLATSLLTACATSPDAQNRTAPTDSTSSRASSASTSTSGSPSPSTGTPTGTSQPSQVTLAFAGDVHFERQVAALLDDPDSDWARRMPELAAADFAMVNLETAITDRGRPEDKTYTFRTSPKALDKLAAAGVDAVSMANNHAADFGAPGVKDTLAAQSSAPIPVVGFGRDERQAFAPATIDVRGVKVAVLASSEVADETARNWAAGPDSPGIATHLDLERLRAATRKAAQDHDLVVAFLHWGTENTTCPNERQRRTAAALEADGADIVVGTHAHRPQGSGRLGRALVGFGLGNHVWYNTSLPTRSSGVLVATVDAQRARARGAATGADRRTAEPLVTSWKWVPKLISTLGVPRTPTGSHVERLADLNDAAQRCADLDRF